jgi:hypothetical protein
LELVRSKYNMANFFTNLLIKLGLEKPEKPMTFQVGEGLTLEQKQRAEVKVSELAKRTSPLPPLPDVRVKNFFADIVRDVPRSAAALTMKYVTGEEKFQPGTGVAPEVEKWLFGIEPIEKPKGVWQTGMAVLGALPILPGKKKAAEMVGKEVAEEIGEKIIRKVPGTKALKITEEAGNKIINTAKSIGEELSKIKGKPLTYVEVKEAAKTSDMLRKVTTRAETLAREAKIQVTKQHLAALAEGKGVGPEFINTLKVISSEATNLGRQLNSLQIEAVPELVTTKTQIVKKLLESGIESKKIVQASKGVDFTNANDVTKFYRQFVKPKLGEVIDEYRYINLLSSPRNHIVNAFSNMLQTSILNPVTKLYSGGIDLVASGLTGKARQAYVSETPVYFKGAINSIGDAVKDTLKVLKGQEKIYRPDISRIPTGSKILAPLQFIPRILEASDVFFRTLITSGEKEALAYRAIKQGKNVTPKLITQIEEEAAKKAEYFVFRAPLNAIEQGKLLSKIDDVTKIIYSVRDKVPLGKWFLPFVTTPMNILKQGIEYSPAGVITMIGAANKTEQLAKTLVGSTVFAGAGFLALKGDSTWSAPTDQKEKEYFYASGKQAYSIKIGDYWINYSKLGPLAYPIAMTAAINYYTRQSPQRITDDNLAKISKTIAGIGGFFSDQSYVQGMGDMLDTLSGDVYSFGRMMSNIPSQVVPLSSLLRWTANITDPIFRETKKGVSAESIIENLKKGLPVLKQTLPAFKEPLGEESKRQFPITNALSPIGITVEKKDFKDLYDLLMEKREMSAELRKIKEDLRKELGL